MRGTEEVGFFSFYIYNGFLVILYLSGRVRAGYDKNPDQPEPASGFFKRPIPDPIIYRAG